MTKAAHSKAKPRAVEPDPGAVAIHAKPGADRKALEAQTILRPSVQAACTIRAYSKFQDGDGPTLMSLVDELGIQVGAIKKGDLGRPEAMLLAQAHSLDAIFSNLARRAALQEHLLQYETHLRLALKAQSQCRATLETLALIKNPPNLAFVKQANIAHGPQQVNNSPEGSRARETGNLQSKLLEVHDGKRLDTTTAGATGGADLEMATVGTVNRTTDSQRQG
jgi:hypothetical protein